MINDTLFRVSSNKLSTRDISVNKQIIFTGLPSVDDYNFYRGKYENPVTYTRNISNNITGSYDLVNGTYSELNYIVDLEKVSNIPYTGFTETNKIFLPDLYVGINLAHDIVGDFIVAKQASIAGDTFSDSTFYNSFNLNSYTKFEFIQEKLCTLPVISNNVSVTTITSGSISYTNTLSSTDTSTFFDISPVNLYYENDKSRYYNIVIPIFNINNQSINKTIFELGGEYVNGIRLNHDSLIHAYVTPANVLNFDVLGSNITTSLTNGLHIIHVRIDKQTFTVDISLNGATLNSEVRPNIKNFLKYGLRLLNSYVGDTPCFNSTPNLHILDVICFEQTTNSLIPHNIGNIRDIRDYGNHRLLYNQRSGHILFLSKVITNLILNGTNVNLQYEMHYPITTMQTKFTVPANSLNYSNNASLFDTITGERIQGLIGINTYITKVGLYNKYGELVAICNLSKPIRKLKNTNMFFSVNLDIIN